MFPHHYVQPSSGPKNGSNFKSQIASFLDSRYVASHILSPVLEARDTAFFTYGDDEVLQRTWARETGMPGKPTLTDILLAQIEAHRTEVFYNLDPMRYDSNFVRSLPGCVKKTVAWRSEYCPGADFAAYDFVLSNFPSRLKDYAARGWKTAYFSPAHDPAMDEYATNNDRPIDVLFVGTYSRHHMRRAAVLKVVAALGGKYRIKFCLAASRLTRLAESPFGYLTPLGKYRRPSQIRSIAGDPVYGREMYSLISKAKIALNVTAEMSGNERGSMRCFETMGLRSLLFSDEGVYPEGMLSGKTLLTYGSASDVGAKLQEVLRAPDRLSSVADAGYKMMRSLYSKERQWIDFEKLVGTL
jgi:hypothetical protein